MVGCGGPTITAGRGPPSSTLNLRSPLATLLSLHQIQGLLKAWHGSRNAPEAMAEVRDTFTVKLAETREAIARYEMLARELEGTLEYLRTCQACRPPRTTKQDCPHCPEDHGMKAEPADLNAHGLQDSPAIVRMCQRMIR